jgi:peptidylprolyl isomerase
VSGKKRNRQRVNRQRAAALAAREAKRKAARRRIILIGGGAVAVLVIVLGIVLTRGGSDDKTKLDTTKSTSKVAEGATTTAPALPSAAGKPCVAMTDPLPAGAPAVPVEVGPPPTQLIKKDLKEGTGAVVGATDTVTANYIGVSCSTGKMFDASYTRGQPASFPLNQVIKGWTDGLPGMKVGGQRLLGIPADQAYGAEGRPPSIAPNEALWFVVEITATKPA